MGPTISPLGVGRFVPPSGSDAGAVGHVCSPLPLNSVISCSGVRAGHLCSPLAGGPAVGRCVPGVAPPPLCSARGLWDTRCSPSSVAPPGVSVGQSCSPVGCVLVRRAGGGTCPTHLSAACAGQALGHAPWPHRRGLRGTCAPPSSGRRRGARGALVAPPVVVDPFGRHPCPVLRSLGGVRWKGAYYSFWGGSI